LRKAVARRAAYISLDASPAEIRILGTLMGKSCWRQTAGMGTAK
jgi:hypothetical protein